MFRHAERTHLRYRRCGLRNHRRLDNLFLVDAQVPAVPAQHGEEHEVARLRITGRDQRRDASVFQQACIKHAAE